MRSRCRCTKSWQHSERLNRAARNHGPAVPSEQTTPTPTPKHIRPVRLRDGKGARGEPYLDRLGIQAQPLLLIRQKVLDILALVALELDDLAHFQVGDNGAIAGKLLLDDFENLLLVKLLGQALHRGQGLAAIALLDPNVDVVLLRLLDLAGVFIRFRERVEGLEILDGHTRAGEGRKRVCWRGGGSSGWRGETGVAGSGGGVAAWCVVLGGEAEVGKGGRRTARDGKRGSVRLDPMRAACGVTPLSTYPVP